MTSYSHYRFSDSQAEHTAGYLMPAIDSLLGELPPGTRLLDVGCGNGALAGLFLSRGCKVVGIDLSESGIEIARKAHPQARFEVLPADDQLLATLNEPPFDVVLSTEVVEHLYAPRPFARGCQLALRPGGTGVFSTPYFGYLKNLMLSLAGRWDITANPLWDGGHIKLWSRRRLTELLTEAGFTDIRFAGAGRLPYLWKSMVLSGRKPG